MHAHQLGTIAARTAPTDRRRDDVPRDRGCACGGPSCAAFRSALKSCLTRNGDGCGQLSTEQQKIRGAQRRRIDLFIIATWRLAASLGVWSSAPRARTF
jgi:hypothetical protein